MSFVLSTLLYCLSLLALSALFAFGARLQPNLWRTLPRHRVLGLPLGIAALAWCAAYALPMLEGPASGLRMYIKILVPVAVVLSFFFLSYLFTRALGGLLILGVTHLLGAAFAARPEGRAIYSLICYIFATAGLGLIVFPWFFRDMLQNAVDSARWRYIPATLITALAAIMAVIAFL